LDPKCSFSSSEEPPAFSELGEDLKTPNALSRHLKENFLLSPYRCKVWEGFTEERNTIQERVES
jgi:hypothetical protein